MAAGTRDLDRGAVARVHPVLRPYVTAIVGYHDVLSPTAVHYGVASASATVILAFDEPLDSGWLATPGAHTRYWSLLAGLHTAPALIRTHGHQHGIQVGLTPLGVRALLGLPAAAVAGEQVELTDASTAVPASLHSRLADAPGWRARFGLLQSHLLALLDAPVRGDPPPEVAQVWRMLAQTHGALRIGDVAATVGWTRRRLNASFASEFGVGPKQAARLLRLDRARALAGAGAALADVAASVGYADQAHLTREWHELAGAPPRRSLAEPYIDDPFLQDDAHLAASG